MSTLDGAKGDLVRSFFDHFDRISLPFSGGIQQVASGQSASTQRGAAGTSASVPQVVRKPVSLDDDREPTDYGADDGWGRGVRHRPKVHHPWDIRVGNFTRDFNIRFAPRRVPGLRYLGTIRRGLQLGALAINEQGDYVQANGDVVQKLKRASIERAIQALPQYAQAELSRLARGDNAQGQNGRRQYVR